MQANHTENSNDPLNHVLNRFPDHIQMLKMLYEHSPTFREICADYAEICIWIEQNCQSQRQPNKNCNYAQEVTTDLETEVMDCLERKDKVVHDEYTRSKG